MLGVHETWCLSEHRRSAYTHCMSCSTRVCCILVSSESSNAPLLRARVACARVHCFMHSRCEPVRARVACARVHCFMHSRCERGCIYCPPRACVPLRARTAGASAVAAVAFRARASQCVSQCCASQCASRCTMCTSRPPRIIFQSCMVCSPSPPILRGA